MRLLLATLCLNEMEWLPQLYQQHKDWPGLIRWVFVEAADALYARCNPSLVTSQGLSTDGTSEYLTILASQGDPISYIPYGISQHPTDLSQSKCLARQQYLMSAEVYQPDFIGVLDADEFYLQREQKSINNILLAAHHRSYQSFCFPQREIWRPPSIATQPLFRWEVTGGYWNIRHCRFWRWQPGLRYGKSHNWLEDAAGNCLTQRMKMLQLLTPTYVHTGFASSVLSRSAKNAYYVARGEGSTDNRGWYVASRKAWVDWKSGVQLPYGAQVIPYTGEVPECFREMPS